MKTAGNIFLGLLLLYAQTLFSHKFAILNVEPNFLVCFFIIIGMRYSLNKALLIAFIFALLNDLEYPQLMGVGTFSAVLVTYLVSTYKNSINIRKFAVVFTSMIALNFISLITYISYKILIYDFTENLLFNLAVFLIYNSILTTSLVYFLQFISRIRLYLDV